MPRPRSISEDDALDQALMLFWERGFDRTSVSDLGKAMGLGPSSLYNAFGSKADLFRKVLDRYMQVHAAFLPPLFEIRETEGVGEALRDLLQKAVRLYTAKGTPQGCAIFQGGGGGGAEDSDGGQIALEFRAGLEAGLRTFFDGCQDPGELAAPARTLAKYLVGSMRGLSQLAVDGTSRAELMRVADHIAASCVLA